jgi:Cdc6-like AAA superfamily ATPase
MIDDVPAADSMIVDSRWFRDEWVPSELPHRHQEKQQFANAIERANDGKGAEDILVSGSSGVGKTVLARTMLERLSNVCTTHVNCSPLTTSNILEYAIQEHPREAFVRPNAPVEKLLDILEQITDLPYILLLDEADGILEHELFGELWRVPKVSIIAITHNPSEWTERVEEATGEQSSLKEIPLEGYTEEELVDILEPRAKNALYPDAWTPSTLEQIGRGIAVNGRGSARFAIQSLRFAAITTHERRGDRINEADVNEAFGRARRWIRGRNVASLRLGEHVVYEIIRQADRPLRHGEICERYDAIAPGIYADRDQEPVSDRQIRTYRNTLIEYDLVTKDGSGSWGKYSAVDEGLDAPIDIPPPARSD